MKLSVIIPTYNRSKALDKCLDNLLEQTASKELYEIIIIDDGSDIAMPESTKEKIKKYNIRLFEETHGGPAKARNVGIRNVQGEIVLFIGDDIMADRGLIEEHIKGHDALSEDNVAILGNVDWPRTGEHSPFLDWLDQGVQFGYGAIKNCEDAPYDCFYTSNISIKKAFLLEKGLFDEDFKYAAFEDTELGYRLKKKGLKIVYRKEASAQHDHIINKKDYLDRTVKAGKALKLFMDKHPELKEKYIDDVKNLFIKRILTNIIWNVPEPIALCMPKKVLYAGYKHQVYFSLKKGYES